MDAGTAQEHPIIIKIVELHYASIAPRDICLRLCSLGQAQAQVSLPLMSFPDSPNPMPSLCWDYNILDNKKLFIIHVPPISTVFFSSDYHSPSSSRHDRHIFVAFDTHSKRSPEVH